jgi:3-oxoacyl-[acyl-carrier protein] reductase
MSAGPPLAGKVAIVTGAGRGIGRAMALGLAAAGAAVVATASRQTAELEALAAEGGEEQILPILADVTKEEDCARVTAAALARFGRIDVLVNNAARGMRTISETFLSQPTHFWEVDPDAWRLLIDTNVNGPFLMARAVVPTMLAAHSGRIINVSVKHDSMRRAGFSPYGPSKAALEAETIIWARDLAGTGITVNALLPGGLTRTRMIPEPVAEALGGQLLDPQVVVPPLLWLAGPDAAEVTGRRFVAINWRTDLPPQKAASLAAEDAGWPPG